jgi:hypothetical protein
VNAPRPGSRLEHQRAVFRYPACFAALAAAIGQGERDRLSLVRVQALPLGAKRSEPVDGEYRERAVELDEQSGEQ